MSREYYQLDLNELEEEMAPLPKMLTDYDKHRNRLSDRYNLQKRQFIAWDGEGITYDSSPQQSYVLFAASTGDFRTTSSPQGLSTFDCLELLFRVERQNPTAIHIGFGFSYDTNQILNSFSRDELMRLDIATKFGRTFKWRDDIKFKIHPGKLFQVSRPDGDTRITVRIYDTLGYFQTSFINVVKKYSPERLSEIESGKGARGDFRYEDIEEITRYCLAENSLLVEIMEKIRGDLWAIGLNPRDWHGPGAIASASLKFHQIKQHMGETPPEVKRIGQYAYQGGRFEDLWAGYHKGKIWEYDINSAYPSAIQCLPSFKEGFWEHTTKFEPGVFGVWNISFRAGRCEPGDFFRRYYWAFPLFFRTRKGRIVYPPTTQNWYWQPEAELLVDCAGAGEFFDIREGYVWRGTDEKPFSWVEERYNERLAIGKDSGGGRVIKLELNSLYGKMAERVGWYKPGDKIPSHHQLQWAGYITSSTRAKLYRAYLQNPEAIIAFETDALFSRAPLDLPISSKLGDWSETTFDEILYVQSGFYFTDSVARYRGFDKGSLTFERVMEWLDKLEPRNQWDKKAPKLFGPTHRFVGYRRALKTKERWRSWVSEEREITIGLHGKREHFLWPCPGCRNGKKWSETMHPLQHHHSGWGEMFTPGELPQSHPHSVPWLDLDFDGELDYDDWRENKEMGLLDGSL